MKRTCSVCEKEYEYKHSIPPGDLEKKAETDMELYKHLVCSDECLSEITGGEIKHKREPLFDMQLKLYDYLNDLIYINPEFTYIIIDKLEYDKQKSDEKNVSTYLAEWIILRINAQGKMTIDEPIDKTSNFDFGGAWYSDEELGLTEGVKLESVVVGWNNLQYFKAQKDKDKCLMEIREYGDSKLWKTRKKYYVNAIAEFREWYRKNRKTPPDKSSFVEAPSYPGTQRSPKVIRLLELAKENNLVKGQTPPLEIKKEIAQTLIDENLGETPTDYVRRTLTKFGYSKPRAFHREWHTSPVILPKTGVSRPGPQITASDAALDNVNA